MSVMDLFSVKDPRINSIVFPKDCLLTIEYTRLEGTISLIQMGLFRNSTYETELY